MSQLDTMIRFCGLYEAELLVTLMLERWAHPLADDSDYANHLLETAADILNRSKQGERFLDDIPPADMNFVAAVWYAEWCQIQGLGESGSPERQDWLTNLRRSVPGCFCDPDDLL
ncbi:MAG: hypothetical protein IID34_02630 [Planctomycetes bacterium]|nr:hypothetical protein [Planctomycetota bacterium]